MEISYSILTHNETDSLESLLNRLIEYKDPEDEIVIVDDYSDNEKTIELLETYSSINTVDGLTDEHIRYWGWNVNDQGWINFPDWQPRIHRNRSNIRWIKPVHEIMEGFAEYSFLPTEPEYCLTHHKTIDRQEKQNAFYSTGEFWKNQ